jgi:hypothetical protein
MLVRRWRDCEELRADGLRAVLVPEEIRARSPRALILLRPFKIYLYDLRLFWTGLVSPLRDCLYGGIG